MKMVTVIAACLFLAPRATLCGEVDVERLSRDASELARRVSRTEDTLSELAKLLISRGHYSPDREKRAEKQRRM